MPSRAIPGHLTPKITNLIACLACLIAIVAGSRYLDAIEQVDTRQTDLSNLARLDADQQRQYREYPDHQVAPGTAAQWVQEDREMTELKQSIRKHEIAMQYALLDGKRDQ